MRLSPLLVSALLFAALPALGFAQAKPAAAAAEEEAKVEGLEIARNGGFLGVTLEGLRLRVTFYDGEKKKTAPDAVRIAARWDHPRQTGGFKTAVLTPDGPDSLASPGVLMPPHTYNVFLVLVGADDKPLDNLVVNLGEVVAAAKK